MQRLLSSYSTASANEHCSGTGLILRYFVSVYRLSFALSLSVLLYCTYLSSRSFIPLFLFVCFTFASVNIYYSFYLVVYSIFDLSLRSLFVINYVMCIYIYIYIYIYIRLRYFCWAIFFLVYTPLYISIFSFSF
jgi:hypothetical protein